MLRGSCVLFGYVIRVGWRFVRQDLTRLLLEKFFLELLAAVRMPDLRALQIHFFALAKHLIAFCTLGTVRVVMLFSSL